MELFTVGHFEDSCGWTISLKILIQNKCVPLALNKKKNVVSKKQIDPFYILHSLSVAYFIFMVFWLSLMDRLKGL